MYFIDLACFPGFRRFRWFRDFEIPFAGGLVLDIHPVHLQHLLLPLQVTNHQELLHD